MSVNMPSLKELMIDVSRRRSCINRLDRPDFKDLVLKVFHQEVEEFRLSHAIRCAVGVRVGDVVDDVGPHAPVQAHELDDRDELAKGVAALAVEADHPYDAWKQLQGEEAAAAGLPRAMGVGDVLADEQNALLLLNYWGFDPAAWFDPEASKNPFAREGAPEAAQESTRETAEQVV